MAIDETTELEIKFTGAMHTLAAIPEGPLAQALTRGEGSWARLETTYFDTSDNLLAAAGLSLRKRRDSAGMTQTVKAVGRGGVAARREWETPLTDASFPALTGDWRIDAALACAAGALKPRVEMQVDRWSSRIPFRNSEIELAVDLGKVLISNAAYGHREAPLAELELELIAGKEEDLFSAAKLFLAVPGLRLNARSKLQTAKAMAAGAAHPVPRRRKLAVVPDSPAGDVLAEAMAAVAERLILIAPAVTEARAAEGVHQMRVELRRFRAIERVFRRQISGSRLRTLTAEARRIARALGPARDWDVFLGETMPAVARGNYAPGGFDLLAARANSIRARCWNDAIAEIADPSFSAFAFTLLEAAHTRPWRSVKLEQPIGDMAQKALNRRLRKTVRTAQAIDPSAPSSRHQLRVALKKQRYAVQLFRSLYAKDRRLPYMRAMVRLQESFGAMNDAVVAQGLANEAAEGGGAEAMRAAGFIGGYYGARADAAAQQIDAAWSAFEKMSPFWRD